MDYAHLAYYVASIYYQAAEKLGLGNYELIGSHRVFKYNFVTTTISNNKSNSNSKSNNLVLKPTYYYQN